MKVLIAGGTGLIGKRIANILIEGGNEVTTLTRVVTEGDGKQSYVKWSGELDDMGWVAEVGKQDAVINLSGRSISDKWNEQVKASIQNSRIESTRTLVSGMNQMEEKPKILVNASAIGYYGSRGDEVLTEDSEPGDDFFSKLCVEWENEAYHAEELGIRVVTARTSIVLDEKEGALPQIAAPLRRGVGSRLGTGNQWVSWVHAEDVARAMVFFLEGDLRGPVNIASPNPVINRDFMKAIASAMGKRAWLPAPAAVLKGMLGEMADYLLLSSQRVSCSKLQAAGFTFKYPDLAGALKAIFHS